MAFSARGQRTRVGSSDSRAGRGGSDAPHAGRRRQASAANASASRKRALLERVVDKPLIIGYVAVMCRRFILLLSLVCCAALFVAAEVACARMIIREVPLNRTPAWEKRVAMLRRGSGNDAPSIRVGADSVASGPRETLSADGVPQEWRGRIRRASIRHGVSEALLAAVLKAESNFNAHAVSPKGARGAMQIMPAVGRELGLGNFFDPEANLDAGAAYLASLLREFPRPELALAAYNAGPEAVRRHGGLPPYEETRGYVARVLDLFRRYSLQLP